MADAQPPQAAQPGTTTTQTTYTTTRSTTAQTRAAKRTEIGLDPARETAPEAVLRPPDESQSWPQALAVLALVLLLALTLLLLSSRLLSPDTTWATLFSPLTGKAPDVSVSGALPDALAQLSGWRLLLKDDFNAAASAVADRTVENQMAGAVVHEAGVYRIQAWPGQVGWTLIDPGVLAYRFETSATVNPSVPAASAGVIARYTSPGNFYLLSVDGSGKVKLELWQDGTPSSVPVAASVGLGLPAGLANRLAVEDDAVSLRFYVNQVPVSIVNPPQLAPNRPGLAAVNPGTAPATVDFDWVTIYQPEKS